MYNGITYKTNCRINCESVICDIFPKSLILNRNRAIILWIKCEFKDIKSSMVSKSRKIAAVIKRPKYSTWCNFMGESCGAKNQTNYYLWITNSDNTQVFLSNPFHSVLE